MRPDASVGELDDRPRRGAGEKKGAGVKLMLNGVWRPQFIKLITLRPVESINDEVSKTFRNIPTTAWDFYSAFSTRRERADPVKTIVDFWRGVIV
jgi:hypothetical protein